ncbi:MAG: hypothetical protein BA066_03525 [Candidatus Korarchaeota archaeon NZ13-K]|nr:MAG: hypothetical protein BA066_03525 [Candidatus Korarchaeota archaeon NZ13-K]
MREWRAIALSIALLSVLLLSFHLYRESERASLKELKIIWPDPGEIAARWCSANSSHRYLESALISCEGGSCYSLLRYLVYFPTDDEFEEELPLEIWQKGQIILKTNVTAFKRNYSLYVQTVALLVKIPREAEVRVLGLGLRPAECLGRELRPPQVIYTRGVMDEWITLRNGFRVQRIFDDLYAASWRGNASLICGDVKIHLRQIEPSAGDIAIISLSGRCEVELDGVRSPLGS